MPGVYINGINRGKDILEASPGNSTLRVDMNKAGKASTCRFQLKGAKPTEGQVVDVHLYRTPNGFEDLFSASSWPTTTTANFFGSVFYTGAKPVFVSRYGIYARNVTSMELWKVIKIGSTYYFDDRVEFASSYDLHDTGSIIYSDPATLSGFPLELSPNTYYAIIAKGTSAIATYASAAVSANNNAYLQGIPNISYFSATDPTTMGSGLSQTIEFRIVLDIHVDRLFYGFIDQIDAVDRIPSTHWEIGCSDYLLGLNRKLVVETYKLESLGGEEGEGEALRLMAEYLGGGSLSLAADQIVKDLLDKYTTPGEYSQDYIQPGAPVVEEISFNYECLGDCITAIANHVNWRWYVDFYKRVHFYDPAASPLVDAPIQIVPGGKFTNFKFTTDISNFRNRVYVRGGKMLSSLLIEPKITYQQADERQYSLTYPPMELELIVGGVSRLVGVEGQVQEETVYALYNTAESYLRLAAQTSTPAAGTPIEIKYKTQVDVFTMSEDETSIASAAAIFGGDGIFEHIIIDEQLTSLVAAEGVAAQDLLEYANPKVSGSFESYVSGWWPGQIVTVILPDYGISNQFEVQSVSIKHQARTYVYDVKFGGKMYGVADWLAAMANNERKRAQTDGLFHKITARKDTVSILDYSYRTTGGLAYTHDASTALFDLCVYS